MKKRLTDNLAEALHPLFDETVALFHRLTAEAENIHQEGGLSAAVRGVLRDLRRHGDQTVPGMARKRPVSRQHIQALVNRLHAAGLVEFVENPAHRRSQLVRLTPEGLRKIDAMEKRETKLLAQLDVGSSPEMIERASQALKNVRCAMESREWARLLKKK